MHAPQLRFLDQSFGEPQLTAVPKKGAAKAVRKKGARKMQERRSLEMTFSDVQNEAQAAAVAEVD